MQIPEQNKPKRKRINPADNPDTRLVVSDGAKIVLDKLVYGKENRSNSV